VGVVGVVGAHSGLACGRRIFKIFIFLIDMCSFNIQTINKKGIFKFSKRIVQKM
jgi:hypothetical protein